MIRLGTPESERAGVALEISNGGRRVALRAWHPTAVLPAAYFTREEVAHALGIPVPEEKRRHRRARTFPHAERKACP